MEQGSYNHAITLLNLAQIEVQIGVVQDVVQRNNNTAKLIFNTIGYLRGVSFCDVVQAEIDLRGDMLGAKTSFFQTLRVSWGWSSETVASCLERLGDRSYWDASGEMSSWPTTFLAYSLKSKEKLGILKALQFLGDLFLTQDDEDTALSLFTVALDGFTSMDVHRSRGECMLRLGDISKRHNNLLKALELWQAARPLFERSSQVKQVMNIEEMLAGISPEVLKEHRDKLASLAELNAFPRTSEEDSDDLREDLEKMDEKEVVLSVL
jgi:hypothetical protein